VRSGEAGAPSLQRLASHVEATYLASSEATRSIPTDHWWKLATHLGKNLSEAVRSQWIAGLRTAYVQDPEVLAGLKWEEVARLGDALNALGDEQAFTPLASWVEATTAWQSLAATDLASLAGHLTRSGEAGAPSRRRLASHVEATYLASAEATRSVSMGQWEVLTACLAKDLSEAVRSQWIAGLRSAYVQDPDVLAGLKWDDLSAVDQALHALGDKQVSAVVAQWVEKATVWRTTEDERLLQAIGRKLSVRGLTGTGKGYPAFASTLARLAKEGKLAAPLGWESARILAAPLGTPETQQVVRDELLDAQGTPRLVIAKILAWVHRNAGNLETWRDLLDTKIAASDGDTKARWLQARAYAEALVSEKPDRLAGKTWLEEALSVAESPSLRLEAVRDLVLACAAADRYDDGLACLKTVAGQFTGEAAETLEALGEEVRQRKTAWIEEELATTRWRAEYLEGEAMQAAQKGDETIQAFLLRRAAISRERERELLGMRE